MLGKAQLKSITKYLRIIAWCLRISSLALLEIKAYFAMLLDVLILEFISI
jgi:hypothetical protein